MVPSSLSLTRKSPHLFRLVRFSHPPIIHSSHKTHVSLNPAISGLRPCSSCLSYSTHHTLFKHIGASKGAFWPLSPNRFRVLAVGDDDSGNIGGFGGSGNGNSGGGGEGGAGAGGGNGWSFLSWYLALLAKYPVLTKAVTSALLTFLGDLICQLMIDQVPSLDLKRTLIFSLLGLVLVGPTLHFWYLYLSKLLAIPGASGAILRLLLDQFLFSPIFIGVFLSTLVTLDGRPSQVVPKLQQEWFSAVLANWQLWIPFQFLNFRFVPQQFQVLAANVIALAWNVILSFKAHKEVLPK